MNNSNKKSLSKEELSALAKKVQKNNNLTDEETKKWMYHFKMQVSSLGLGATLFLGNKVHDKYSEQPSFFTEKLKMLAIATSIGMSVKSLYHSFKMDMILHKSNWDRNLKGVKKNKGPSRRKKRRSRKRRSIKRKSKKRKY